MEDAMTYEQAAMALNEWMRRYIEDPQAFSAEFQTVGKYLEELSNGHTPSYGAVGAGYMRKIIAESAC